MKTPLLARQIAGAPDRFRFRGRENAPAGKRYGNRRAIVFGSIALGLAHQFLRARRDRQRDDGKHHAGRVPDHGDFVAVSAVIGWLFSSSRGTP
jgi:hypothetical protein